MDKILDESDFDVYGNKVKLSMWMHKGEMDKLLEMQEYYIKRHPEAVATQLTKDGASK